MGCQLMRYRPYHRETQSTGVTQAQCYTEERGTNPKEYCKEARHWCQQIGQTAMQCSRRCKKWLPGGVISTPCLPTTAEIMDEKNKLIELGELTIGEPCTPYITNKFVVDSLGELEVRPSEIYGRKIPFLELRKKLLVKQEKYMRICNASVSDEELL